MITMLRNIIENNNPVIRGEVYLAELPSGSGSEQVGKRPVVVLSNNTNNAHSNIINVAAITSKNKPLPVHVYVGRNGGLKTESTVDRKSTRLNSSHQIIS